MSKYLSIRAENFPINSQSSEEKRILQNNDFACDKNCDFRGFSLEIVNFPIPRCECEQLRHRKRRELHCGLPEFIDSTKGERRRKFSREILNL